MAAIRFYDPTSTSIDGSTEDSTYSIRIQQVREPAAPAHPDRCSVAIFLIGDGVQPVRVFIPCRQSEQICKDLLGWLFVNHLPYMAPPSERLLDDFLRVVKWANECHRCPKCHPSRFFKITQVLIKVRPHPRILIKPASKASVAHLLEEECPEEVIGGECVICMDQIKTQKSALRMPCAHVFHEPCLVQWLNNSHVCPLCRYQMPYSQD